MLLSYTHLSWMPEDQTEDKQHLGSWPLHSYDPQTSHLTWSHRTETKEGAKTQGMTLRDVTV